MDSTVRFEHFDGVNTDAEQACFDAVSRGAAERAGVSAPPLIVSGDFARSIDDRIGVVGYNVAHRGSALTVARTFAKAPREPEVVLNFALVTPDGKFVEAGENRGLTARFVAHEFMHAATIRRDEPSRRPHQQGNNPAERFWLAGSWKAIDEYRAERAIVEASWPQDIDYAEDFIVTLTNYLDDAIHASALELTGAVTAPFTSLCDRLGFAAASSDLDHNPTWTRYQGLGLTSIVRKLRDVPHSAIAVSVEEMDTHSRAIATELEGWIRHLGIELTSVGAEYLSATRA